ncbi:MAG TPA: hypothetical protein VFJ58_13135 [Armatimonadota bacterium]|nr:hypothetical protein [Armatimonadota bacterium]
MIDRTRFDLIRERRGSCASWAVWEAAGARPKSNVGDLGGLDPDLNAQLLSTLHDESAMVGLNISRPLQRPFRNFHDPRPRAQDFKIRHAFRQTKWWGSYMTDFIKNVEALRSSELQALLTPDIIARNVASFASELQDLGSAPPILLVFGTHAHCLIDRHVPRASYRWLIKLTHYSHYIVSDDYPSAVLKEIAEALCDRETQIGDFNAVGRDA